MLRNLTKKALEWKVSVFIADGDLPKAYDNARHSVAAKRLVERGFPSIVVVATLRETIKSQRRIRMGVILTGPIRRTRSLCQGNSDAPKLFQHNLDVDSLGFHELCQENQWGYPIKDGASDNITFRLGIFGFCKKEMVTRMPRGTA